jgi:hypothetical protein
MVIRSLIAVSAAVVLLSGCGPASNAPATLVSTTQSNPTSARTAQAPTATPIR